MHRFAMLLKSYGRDLEYAKRLAASFASHNADHVHLFVVVPEEDAPAFEAAIAGPDVTVMSEAVLGRHLVDREVAGIRPGYINQEIVKLSFWELGLAENYFCVDSEAVFVRDFGVDDFMCDERTPYTVLVEDNDLKVEPRYFKEHWQGRERHLRHIQELVGLHDRRLLTCHGHQVMSAAVLASLKSDFMEPRGWTYVDLLREAPYEFSWYNFWLQKARTIPIETREPLVKTLHHDGQYLEYAMRGVTEADIARGYVGVVVNSNFLADDSHDAQRHRREDVLAEYVPPKVLAGALAKQVRRKLLGR